MPSWRNAQKTDDRLYVGVSCLKCETPILFAEDRSEGQGPIAGWTRLVLTCPDAECRHQGDYSGAPIGRFQKVGDLPVAVAAGADS